MIGHLRRWPFLVGSCGGRCRNAGRIFVEHTLGERYAELGMGGFEFVVRLGVHLKTQIEHRFRLLESAGRLEIARPADVENRAFGADIALIEQLVQIEGVRFQVDLRG